MRSLGVLCLSAAVALLAIAALAPAVSSATVICEAEGVAIEVEEEVTLGCHEDLLYGTDIAGSETIAAELTADSPAGEGSGEIYFEAEIGKVVCPQATLEAGIESSGSPVALGSMTSFAFPESCTTTISGCTVTSIVSATPFEIQAEYSGFGIEERNGLVKAENPDVSISFSCLGGLFEPVCTYDGGTEEEPVFGLGDYYNPENEASPSSYEGGILDVEDTYVLTEASGSGSELCPEVGVVRATYGVTAPESSSGTVAVADAAYPTRLCEEVPTNKAGVLECPKNSYSGEVTGKETAVTKLTSTVAKPAGAVECEESRYKGSFGVNGKGGTDEFYFEAGSAEETEEEGKKLCKSTLPEEPDAAMRLGPEAFQNSWIVYRGVANPHGRLWLAFPAKSTIFLIIVLKEKAGDVTCHYPFSSDNYKTLIKTTSFKNGSGTEPSEWSLDRPVERVAENPGGGNKCPDKATFTSSLAVTGKAGVKFYVAGK